jgi:PIN domain nuclease of toxin-antitoxin system
MNLLLDTQIFVWAATGPHKLSQTVRQALQGRENNLFISVASLWEMQIKVQIGKLPLPLSAREFVNVHCLTIGVQPLSVIESHIWALDALPLYHRDPFDRLLVAQAFLKGINLCP